MRCRLKLGDSHNQLTVHFLCAFLHFIELSLHQNSISENQDAQVAPQCANHTGYDFRVEGAADSACHRTYGSRTCGSIATWCSQTSSGITQTEARYRSNISSLSFVRRDCLRCVMSSQIPANCHPPSAHVFSSRLLVLDTERRV